MEIPVEFHDLTRQEARMVAAKWNVPKVYASHEEMFAKEKLDGIVASQPFTRHGTLIPDLLKTGLPVFTEKPIAGSVEMGEKIVKAVAANKTWMMIGYHKRSDPATMLAKQEIVRLQQSQELGKLTYIRILMPSGDWMANGFNQNVNGNDPNPNLLGETWSVKYASKSGKLLAGESASGVTCSIEMTPFSTTVDWQEHALVCFERGWVKIELPAPLAFTRPGRVSCCLLIGESNKTGDYDAIEMKKSLDF